MLTARACVHCIAFPQVQTRMCSSVQCEDVNEVTDYVSLSCHLGLLVVQIHGNHVVSVAFGSAL